MESYREELEKNYFEKLNKLREREKETIDKCKERMKVNINYFFFLGWKRWGAE